MHQWKVFQAVVTNHPFKSILFTATYSFCEFMNLLIFLWLPTIEMIMFLI